MELRMAIPKSLTTTLELAPDRFSAHSRTCEWALLKLQIRVAPNRLQAPNKLTPKVIVMNFCDFKKLILNEADV